MNDVVPPPLHESRLPRLLEAKATKMVGLASLSALAALANATIIDAVYPALTLLGDRAASVAVALGSGILLLASSRFPRAVLLIQAGVTVIVAAIPSLAISALVLGVKRGVTSWQPLACSFAAMIALVASPWMPSGGRLPAPLIVLLPFGAGALIHAASQQRRAREEQLLLMTVNQGLLKEQAYKRERDRIADEVHDQLGHRLTAIEINARLLLADADTDTNSSVASRAAVVKTQADLALRDMQSIIHGADSVPKRHSHPPLTLPQRIREVTAALDLSADITIDPFQSPLPFDTEYVLFRVAQEGATNAARHAPGERIQVHLSQTPEQVTLQLTNRVADRVHSASGRGLASLRRLAENVGGRITTRVSTDAPLYVLECVVPLSGETGHE